jgi:hypothetical protein
MILRAVDLQRLAQGDFCGIELFQFLDELPTRRVEVIGRGTDLNGGHEA